MKLVKTSSQKKNLCIRKHPGQLCYCLWPLSRVRGKKGNKKHENGSQEENKNVHAKTGRKKEKKQKTNKYSEFNINTGLKQDETIIMLHQSYSEESASQPLESAFET